MSLLNVIFSQATWISNFLFLPKAIKAETLSLASKSLFLAPSCIFYYFSYPPPQLCPCIYYSTGAFCSGMLKAARKSLFCLLAGAWCQMEQMQTWVGTFRLESSSAGGLPVRAFQDSSR